MADMRGAVADMPRVLMVAYHYPPCSGTSGVLRTLKFSRYLPDNGWQPIVLTAHPRAYETTRPEDAHALPPSIIVKRSFALDAHRHLAIRGRTLSALALPDRWGSWWPGGVVDGLRLVRRYRPRVLWSTFPIATAHLITLTIQARTGLPWIADFRDPMTEDEYPLSAAVHRMYRWIERRCAERASCLVFTAESARDMYLKRYPELTADRCLVISNGYDEEDYRDLPPAAARQPGAPVRLLHSGMIYRSERDPRALFGAIARLKRGGQTGFRLDLRAPGSEAYYRALIDELGIGDVVRILPAMPYREALADAASADALVLLQDASCNRQIPAKAYEYLRLRRPILALTSAEGDTGSLLQQTGGGTIIDLVDEAAIVDALPRFLAAVRSQTHPLPTRAAVLRFARHVHAAELANILTGVAGPIGAASSRKKVPAEASDDGRR